MLVGHPQGVVSLSADGTGSKGAGLHYFWDFGDGHVSDSGDDRQASHLYLAAGSYTLTLTVVDAVRALRHNGPTGGNLNDVQKLDTVIASADIVAADSYAATLLGLRPADVPYIAAATKMGLGRSDLGEMKIEEIRL